MRPVILGLGISLDGYIARKNGAVDFLVMDPDHDWMAFFQRIDVWLMGRKTLEHALQMQGVEKFESQGLRTIVFSREGRGFEGVEVTNENPASVVRQLREDDPNGKGIWLGGGGELVKSFLEADLVDRIELGIVPTLIGSGIPLFPAGFPERKFKLIESKSYPKTGLLTVVYERATPANTRVPDAS